MKAPMANLVALDGGLHGVGLGNGGTGVGGQSHRRRQVSHNAEVEHEEVGGNHWHTHPATRMGAQVAAMMQ